ncbi:hypothetical protein [Candidatus Sarmatiella mevalonica]|uniref:hypothetical protein n=1 Tax=Candidatus Sarmatiella mevalonica TaxID=2770581 RepID=UPI001922DE07|nr:hypothetical protein [Candidatus Sarmatiella mevalonica]
MLIFSLDRRYQLPIRSLSKLTQDQAQMQESYEAQNAKTYMQHKRFKNRQQRCSYHR